MSSTTKPVHNVTRDVVFIPIVKLNTSNKAISGIFFFIYTFLMHFLKIASKNDSCSKQNRLKDIFTIYFDFSFSVLRDEFIFAI